MNCLRRSNIATVGELIGKGAKELLKLRNFGQKSNLEIEGRLASIGLSLNPKVEEEEPESEEEKPLELADSGEIPEDIVEPVTPEVEESEDGETDK